MADAPAWLRHPVAHRGLHDGNQQVPENSLPAFAAAAEAGVAIELDVRLSADGAVVVHHDATLQRLCGDPARVADLTAVELGGRRLAGTAQGTPSLHEVLDLVAGRVPIMVELKLLVRANVPLWRGVAALLDRYGGPVSVHSFHPGAVGWFARHRPALPRGQAAGAGAGPMLVQRILDAMWSNTWTTPGFVVFSLQRLPDARITALRRGGMPVLAYTVRTGAEQRDALAHADGYFYEAWDVRDPVSGVPVPDPLR